MITAGMLSPKELFSRQRYSKHGFGMTMLREDIYYRVDSLLNKLKELRRLRMEDKLNVISTVDGVLDDIFDDIDIDTTLKTLQTYIGVWNLTYNHIFKGDLGWKPVMIYPIDGRSMSAGDIEKVLGKDAKEGKYLVMASPEAVQWLNKISKLVGVHV